MAKCFVYLIGRAQDKHGQLPSYDNRYRSGDWGVTALEKKKRFTDNTVKEKSSRNGL